MTKIIIEGTIIIVGTVTIVSVIPWVVIAADSPESSKFVSKEERFFLEDKLKGQMPRGLIRKVIRMY